MRCSASLPLRPDERAAHRCRERSDFTRISSAAKTSTVRPAECRKAYCRALSRVYTFVRRPARRTRTRAAHLAEFLDDSNRRIGFRGILAANATLAETRLKHIFRHVWPNVLTTSRSSRAQSRGADRELQGIVDSEFVRWTIYGGRSAFSSGRRRSSSFR